MVSLFDTLGAGLRALVWDEHDSASRQLLVDLLTRAGFRVVAPRNSHDAAEAARQPTDLAFISADAHGGPGLQLSEILRSSAIDCVVVALVRTPGEVSLERAIELGLADIFVTPVPDSDHTQLRLMRMIQHGDAQRSNRLLGEELNALVSEAERNRALDRMTGLYNLTHLRANLDREVVRSRRHGHSIGLLLVDVDGSRKLALAGQGAREAALCRIAQLLSKSARRSDFCYRLYDPRAASLFNGDEFSLLLPETPKHGALIKARIVAEEIASLSASDQHSPLTVSVGVACYPEDGADPRSLIAAAHAALRGAKKAGGNRVVGFGADVAALAVPESWTESESDLESKLEK